VLSGNGDDVRLLYEMIIPVKIVAMLEVLKATPILRYIIRHLSLKAVRIAWTISLPCVNRAIITGTGKRE